MPDAPNPPMGADPERVQYFAALYADLRPECERLIAMYPDSRSALIPMMHLFLAREGYASLDAMRAIGEMLDLSTATVESTISFYTLFFRKPVGKYMLQVCRNLSCSMNGAQEIMRYMREQLGIGHLQTTGDGLFSYEEVECLAACDRAPCMQVNLEFVYDLTPAMVDDMLAAIRGGTYPVGALPQTGAPPKTWILNQNSQVSRGEKSAGAEDVSDPDNPGGFTDSSGVIMLDRIILSRERFTGRTSERLVNEPDVVLDVVREEENAWQH
ncbi:MAG: NAD(P)H-dependent oxidoreductase subunit E [Candidatus Eremiobacteraeota bacterium]|nr:NAD(P)H-dependent oxidoreductase subunit E [Candidatus Eremiobacteraeota bacterium]